MAVAPDRKKFFSSITPLIFGGKIGQGQVDGINRILEGWEAWAIAVDPRFVAYSLGTVFWETGQAMQPVEENDGKPYNHAPYWKPDPDTKEIYYGRGLVQLTWKSNYAKMSQYAGVDLVNSPRMAMDPEASVKIMIAGMTLGIFTGRKLSGFFHGMTTDWLHARQIINGMDKAAMIAGFSLHFYHALTDGQS